MFDLLDGAESSSVCSRLREFFPELNTLRNSTEKEEGVTRAGEAAGLEAERQLKATTLKAEFTLRQAECAARLAELEKQQEKDEEELARQLAALE